TRSLLLDVQDVPDGMVDELRVELPGNLGNSAVLSLAPKNWTLENGGHAVRLSGPVTRTPGRLRITLFDLGIVNRIQVRLRLRNRDLVDAKFAVTELPHLQHAPSASGLIALPPVIHAGEAVEMKVLDPVKTPPQGQWFIGGVAATASVMSP